MLNRDSRCVFVANTAGEADVVVAWLGEQGIEARTMGGAILGGLDLTPWAGKGVSPRGIEVWVQDESRIDAALALLAEASVASPSAGSRETSTEPVDVACDECGVVVTYAAELVGTTQECGECGAFLDVPDGSETDDDEWWAATDDDPGDDAGESE